MEGKIEQIANGIKTIMKSGRKESTIEQYYDEEKGIWNVLIEIKWKDEKNKPVGKNNR